MSSASTLITYVWHYLVVRLVYDQLLRPLIRGHVPVSLLLCGAVLAAFVVARSRTRRARRRRG
jgi:hypothetical protein